MTELKTLDEIRKEGMDALAKALGPVGMVRFIQGFDLGKGNYTKERFQWLGQSTDEIASETETRRTKKR